MSMDRRQTAVRIAKALGDSTRFDLLQRIAARREICCRDLTTLFPVSQATVSHHLKILTEAGLASARRSGQFSYFRVRPEALSEYGRILAGSFSGPRKRPARGRASARSPSSRASRTGASIRGAPGSARAAST
jgi:ArsR family transcriptional regulator